VIITQKDNSYGASSDYDKIIISNSENDRSSFGKASRRMIDIYLEKNTIIRSFDHIFGTSFIYNNVYIIYKQIQRQLYTAVYDEDYIYNGLYVVTFIQAETSMKSTIVPQNLVGILSIMGGFLTLITKLIGWFLSSYQRFTFRKSRIKKLYYYSRTKRRTHNCHEKDEDCESN
jgi:hypothetical protein